MLGVCLAGAGFLLYLLGQERQSTLLTVCEMQAAGEMELKAERQFQRRLLQLEEDKEAAAEFAAAFVEDPMVYAALIYREGYTELAAACGDWLFRGRVPPVPKDRDERQHWLVFSALRDADLASASPAP